MDISFSVNNQILIRADSKTLVAGSRNYIYATFKFSRDWEDCVKTASFTNNKDTYTIGLEEDNSCLVPFDVLQAEGNLLVALQGINNDTGKRITTNSAAIDIKPSGYKEGIPALVNVKLYNALTAFKQELGGLESTTSLKNALPSVTSIYEAITDIVNESIKAMGLEWVVGEKAKTLGCSMLPKYVIKEDYKSNIDCSFVNLISETNVFSQVGASFVFHTGTTACEELLSGGSVNEIPSIELYYPYFIYNMDFLTSVANFDDSFAQCRWFIDVTPYRGQTLEFGFQYFEGSNLPVKDFKLRIDNPYGSYDDRTRTQKTIDYDYINSDTVPDSLLYFNDFQPYCVQYHVADDQDEVEISFAFTGMADASDNDYLILGGLYLSSPLLPNKIALNGDISLTLEDKGEN